MTDYYLSPAELLENQNTLISRRVNGIALPKNLAQAWPRVEILLRVTVF